MKKKARNTLINTFLLTIVYIILFQLIICFTFFISHFFGLNPVQTIEVGVVTGFGTGATIPIFLGNRPTTNACSNMKKE